MGNYKPPAPGARRRQLGRVVAVGVLAEGLVQLPSFCLKTLDATDQISVNRI